jgi:hypothetical protein
MTKKYDIGYMKPPRDTQFKPGTSGNRQGRPRGTKSTYKLLDDLLDQTVQITQDGRQIKINKKTAILLQAVNKAVKGDTRSIQTLFPHMLAADAKNDEREAVSRALTSDDNLIISLWEADRGK